MSSRSEIVEPVEMNPFCDDMALSNSAYLAADDHGGLRRLSSELPETALERAVHVAFRRLVLDPGYPCVGARSAVNRAQYRLGVYGRLGGSEATAGLARDLVTFCGERRQSQGYMTYFAAFADPIPDSEESFERLLWKQLEKLHELDRRVHSWDSAVSSNPQDSNFSFSVAGTGFYVVGLHPHSSRIARRFPWPVLVFNAHEQFDWLRQRGHFGRMQSIIRDRDRALQGNINPMLGDFGDRSEARQYSGRPVEADWSCPFQPGHGDGP